MSKKFINLYIVDNSEQFSGKLEEIFFERRDLGINVIGSSIKYRACAEDIVNVRQADVIMVAAFLPDKSGVELVSYLKKSVNPNAKYIVTLTANTRNVGDEALRLGADATLQKPFNPQKMIELVYELTGKKFVEEDDYEEEKESYVSPYEKEDEEDIYALNVEDDFEEENENIDEIFSQKGFLDETPKPKKKERSTSEMFGGAGVNQYYGGGVASSNKPNKVVTFSAPKSSGKTTTLVNVAAAIKRNSEYDPKIIIVDLNIVYPSIQFALHHDDLKLATKTIYDLMDDIYELDKELLEKAVIVHEPTGIHILDTPFQSIRDFTRVTKEKIQQLILFLREEYDLVLIDTSGNIREDATTIPMAVSDMNIILFQSDFTSLVQTRKFIEMIQLFEERADKRILDNTILILNRYEESSNLSVEKAKNTILDIEGVEINIPLFIPEEPEMTKYSNKGEFIVDKQGATSDKLIDLGALVYPYYASGDAYRKETKKESKSLFVSLLNKIKK